LQEPAKTIIDLAGEETHKYDTDIHVHAHTALTLSNAVGRQNNAFINAKRTF